MFLSARAFFDPSALDLKRTLYRRAETQLPAEFVKRYKRNVVAITPMKTGALRRSIITQAIGTRADIGWRMPYASAQDKGRHEVANTRVVNIDGKFVTLKPGVYSYSNYTTPGTGPNFATTAFIATTAQMQPIYRELGLTS